MLFGKFAPPSPLWGKGAGGDGDERSASSTSNIKLRFIKLSSELKSLVLAKRFLLDWVAAVHIL
jgi:hypothetical protein